MREKEKTKSLYEKLPPIRLFLDDLDKIVEIFKEVSDNINIETKDYYFDNVKEIKNINAEYITDLEIKSREPYISLEFNSNGSTIYAAEDTLITRGALDKIKTILRPRQLKYINPTFHALLNTLLGVTFTSSLMMIGIGIELGYYNQIQYYSLSIIGVVIFIISYFIHKWDDSILFKNYSMISLRKKDDKTSFWKRNWDQFITGAAASFIAGLVIFLLGLLISFKL